MIFLQEEQIFFGGCGSKLSYKKYGLYQISKKINALEKILNILNIFGIGISIPPISHAFMVYFPEDVVVSVTYHGFELLREYQPLNNLSKQRTLEAALSPSGVGLDEQAAPNC